MRKQKNAAQQEQARFWRDVALKNLELLRATYVTHEFAPHIHEGYAIGVIDRGAERFWYRGATHIASQGSVVVVQPGEMHTGSAALEQGWSYRMLYPDVSLIQQAMTSLGGKSFELPFFPAPVIYDPAMAQLLSQLHNILTTSNSALERESTFLWSLVQLISRHATVRPAPSTLRAERGSVQQIRAYLEEHFTENISLEQLSLIANMSPFHLLRVFRSSVGLPPHSYLTYLRILHARRLISLNMPLAEVAGAVGFTDQSHLTRHFKSFIGVTPGQYARGNAFS